MRTDRNLPEPLPNGADRIPSGNRGYAPYEMHYPSEDDGGGMNLRAVLGALRRHVLLIALLTVLGLGLGYWLSQRQVPSFRARATVRVVENRAALAGAAAGQGVRADPLLSQLVVLQSRDFAGELVDHAQLRVIVDTAGILPLLDGLEVTLAPEAAGSVRLTYDANGVVATTAEGSVRAPYGVGLAAAGVSLIPRAPQSLLRPVQLQIVPREVAIDMVLLSFTALPRDGTDAVDLMYVAPDPELATRVANAAAEVFRTVNARSMSQQAVRRRSFLEEQLRLAESRLLRAQRELSDFRQREQVYSSGAKLASEQENLAELDRERRSLVADRALYDGLMQLLASPDRTDEGVELRAMLSSPQLTANPVVSQLVSQLHAQATRRDSMTMGRFALTPLHPEVRALDTLMAATETQLTGAVRGQIQSFDMRLDAIDAQRQQRAADLSTLPDAEAEEVQLIREVGAAENTANQLRTEYEAARIAEAVEAGQVEVVSLASAAQPLGNTAIPVIFRGVLLGLILGCALALALEAFNKSFRRTDEIEMVLQLPGLAVIPNLTILRQPRFARTAGNGANGHAPGLPNGKGKTSKSDGRGIVPLDSPAAEAFRALRTNVLFSSGIQHRKVLLVTSAGPGEGKTTTAANLAIALAQQGMRVLLIDADLRRPRVHTLMGTPRGPGLSDLLLQHSNVQAAFCLHASGSAGLSVLPAGEVTNMPAELLSGSRMESSLRWFAGQFDKVVVDAAPVLAASEAAALASRADGVLVVVRAGSTHRDVAREALRRLHIVGAQVLGVVINDPKEIVARYGIDTYRYATQETASQD